MSRRIDYEPRALRDHPVPEDAVQQIEDYQRKRGWTDGQLAAFLHVAPMTVRRWRYGTFAPKPSLWLLFTLLVEREKV